MLLALSSSTSAAQKQMFRMDGQHWVEELPCACRCLSALRFCGSVDPVAANLLNKLEPVYRKLAISDDKSQNETGKNEADNHEAVMDKAGVGGDGDGSGDTVMESDSLAVLNEGEGAGRGTRVILMANSTGVCHVSALVWMANKPKLSMAVY